MVTCTITNNNRGQLYNAHSTMKCSYIPYININGESQGKMKFWLTCAIVRSRQLTFQITLNATFSSHCMHFLTSFIANLKKFTKLVHGNGRRKKTKNLITLKAKKMCIHTFLNHWFLKQYQSSQQVKWMLHCVLFIQMHFWVLYHSITNFMFIWLCSVILIISSTCIFMPD